MGKINMVPKRKGSPLSDSIVRSQGSSILMRDAVRGMMRLEMQSNDWSRGERASSSEDFDNAVTTGGHHQAAVLTPHHTANSLAAQNTV